MMDVDHKLFLFGCDYKIKQFVDTVESLLETVQNHESVINTNILYYFYIAESGR